MIWKKKSHQKIDNLKDTNAESSSDNIDDNKKAKASKIVTCKTKGFSNIGSCNGAMIKKYSSRRVGLVVLAAILVVAITMSGVMLTLGGSNKNIIPATPNEHNTTVRKQVPADGSLPTEHKPIDNLAYLAYVLDNQTSYHAYANNSTKSTGYEQITQTWKDYKQVEIDGVNRKVMVCSDLSYSALVKSASQSCFVDGKAAIMRTGGNPEKTSTPTTISWNSGTPKKYTKEEYLTTYGEFSTELSVYVINKNTIESAQDTVDNGDGTYSQKFVLKADAACWYQYGMKTRGGLKNVPEFEKIEITFTFDKQWRVLSSYCEEKTKISPAAFGGISMGSSSKTTTTFEYDDSKFDNTHFEYATTYYKEYFDKQVAQGPIKDNEEVVLTDVLMSGFNKVIGGEGQQFNLALTLGEQVYDGKVYVKLASLEDIANSLNIRLALEKRASGKQDLYIEFKEGNIDAYYSDSFAMTANINEVANSVTSLKKAIENLIGKTNEQEITPQSEGGMDIASLLNSLKLEKDDSGVKIGLNSDNLLDLGVGIGLEFNFGLAKVDGINTYPFKNLKLNSLAYKGENISISCEITPDDGEIITHAPSQAPANLATYIEGVKNLVNSESFIIDLSLDGSQKAIPQIEGLKVNGVAQVELEQGLNGVKVNIPLEVDYNGITARLSVYYTYDFNLDNYGKVYLYLTSICGKSVNAKIGCDIKDLVAQVKSLIDMYLPARTGEGENSTNEDASPTTQEQTTFSIAQIVNTVVNLNLGSIVKELKGNDSSIEATLDGDKVLSTILTILNKQFDIQLGNVMLQVNLVDGKVNLVANVSALGVKVGISASDEGIPQINTEEYADATAYINGVKALLTSNSYTVTLSIDNPTSDIEYLSGVKVDATTQVQFSGDYKIISVDVTNLTVDYKGVTANLSLYYNIDLNNGGYGDIYVTLKNIGGKEVNAKVYANIQNTVDAVTSLIDMFKQQDSEVAPPEVYANVVDTITSFDFAKILTKLDIDSKKFEAGVNVDELLKNLKVNVPFALGSVDLSASLENGKISLFGALPKYNISAKVEGCDSAIAIPDKGGYANVEEYVTAVKSLLENNTYALEFTLDGTSSLSYIKDIRVIGNAIVKLDDTFKNIFVQVPNLSVTYKTQEIVLALDYSINLDSKTYGKVYVTIKSIGGKQVDIKAYCDILEVKTSIEKLISIFKTTTPKPLAEQQETATSTANIVDALLKIDFNKLLSTLIVDNSGVNLGVNADQLLSALNINLDGIELGEVSLKATLDASKNLLINVEAKQHGLTLALQGTTTSLTQVDESKYANVTAYTDGVQALLNAETLQIAINYTGKNYTQLKVNLDGLTAESIANIKFSDNFNKVQVNAPIVVAYKGYTAKLDIYYEIAIDSKTYGKVYVTVNELNGKILSAKVKGDISSIVDSVKELIELFAEQSGAPKEQDSQKLAEGTGTMLDKLLAMDFTKVISLLTADNSGVNLSVNADELLKALSINFDSLTIGEASIKATLEQNAIVLLATLPAVGLDKLNIEVSEKAIVEPTEGEFVDILNLLDLARAVIQEGKTIEDSKAVVFDIQKLNVTIDGVKMSISGKGQVSWANNIKQVALDLSMSISEGDKSENLNIKLVYDEHENAKHLVRFVVNNIGLVINKGDIDGLTEGVKQITDTLNLISGKKQENTTEALVAPNDSQSFMVNTTNNIDSDLIKKVVDTLLSYAAKISVKFVDNTEGDIKDMVVTYLNNGMLTLSGNGKIKLSLEINNDNGTQILDMAAGIYAPTVDENLLNVLNGDFDTNADYAFYSSEGKQFTLAVYEYVFALLDNLTVKNLLGTNTYAVNVTLNGDASKIDALKGVSIDANMYYTETADGKKLVEIEIQNLSINSTTVVASIVYYDNYFYITLKKVGDRNLYQTYTDELNNTPITIKASRGEIYRAVDTLVKLITSNKLKAIIPLFKSTTTVTADQLAQNVENTPTTEKTTSIDINKLVSALLELSISTEKVDGKNTFKTNLDNVLSIFGIELGDISITANPTTHAVNAVLSKGETTWASLNAQVVENSIKGVAPNGADYIDIDFIATLLDDIDTTLESLGDRVVENDGVQTTKPDLRVSLTGNVRVDISYSIISTNVRIDNAVVTLGLDEKDKFYFTLQGDLQKSSYLMYTVARAMPIAITYSNGYMTMCRTNSNGDKIYKVMTIEYLIDNLLDKNKSPIRWLLGTSDTPWGLICDAVKLPINSGLTQKEYIYLYDNGTDTVKEDVTMFNLASLLLGLNVKYDNYISTYANAQNAISHFGGMDNNYYAFDLDLRQFIGNAISTLSAAIVRNNEGGIKGVNAFAALDGNYLTLSARLDGGLITTESENRKHAEDTFKVVTSQKSVDFNYFANTENKKFGCYSSEDDWYDYSEYNKLYTLKVYQFASGTDYNTYPINVKGDVLTHDKSHRSGSTVYMFENEQWLDEGHIRKLIYVDENGNDLGNSFTLTADTTIYQMITGKNIVNFYDENSTPCDMDEKGNALPLYAGDKLPNPLATSVEKEGKEYLFAGWYTDANCTTMVTSVQTDINDYYAKYVLKFIDQPNGITYMFAPDTTKVNGGYYIAYWFSAANIKDGVDYSNDNRVLVIANTINGYKVTQISEGAFRSQNGYYIKNIVVPENITVIQPNAFRDNRGMKTISFYAPKVEFLGNSGYNKNYTSITTPFLGCTDIYANVDHTDLVVYYNQIVEVENNYGGKDGNPAWALFHWKADNKPRFIGNDGGARVNSGSAYVTYTVNGDFTKEDLGLTDYITTSVEYNGIKADAIIEKINTYTVQQGYVYGYAVQILGEYKLNSVVTLTVNVTKTTAYYSFTLDKNSLVNSATYTVDDSDKVVYQNAEYIKEGAIIVLEPSAAPSYIFKNWQINGNTLEANEFAMLSSVTTVVANWEADWTQNVYISSQVAFTYEGVEYAAGDKVRLTNAVNGLTLTNATNTDYTFLGWANVNGDALTTYTDAITLSDEIEIIYTALWVKNKNGVTYTYDKATNTLTATVDANIGIFYGWYNGTDTAFSTPVISKNADLTLTHTTTCVRSRLQFTLTIRIHGNNSAVYETKDSVRKQVVWANWENLVVDRTFAILEGDRLNVFVDNLTTLRVETTGVQVSYDANKLGKDWWGKWSETSEKRKFTITQNTTDNGVIIGNTLIHSEI